MAADISNHSSMVGLQLERRLRQVALVAALAVVTYLGLALFSDADAIRDGLYALGPLEWLALLALSLLNYFLRFLRWHAYLLALGARIGLTKDLLIYLAGFAFTVTPAKAGEAVRSIYLRGAGVPWSFGLSALMVERILDLSVMVILAALAIQLFVDQALLAIMVIGVFISALVIVTRPEIARRLLGFLPNRGQWLQVQSGLLEILNNSQLLLAPKRLFGGLLLGLIAWGAEAWGLYLLLVWLDFDLDVLQAIGIYGISMLAGAISFLPGGLGGAEAAMMALLAAGGATIATAALATVICRVVTLWFAVFIGVVVSVFFVDNNK